jgi:cell division protein FtsL
MTYSSSLAMNRTRFTGRNQNSVSFRAQARTLGPVSNTIILIVLACLLGLLYLTQVTKTNAYGYQINTLQQKQSQLRTEHDDLEVASARLQSLQRVKESSTAKNLVSVAPTSTVRE